MKNNLRAWFRGFADELCWPVKTTWKASTNSAKIYDKGQAFGKKIKRLVK